MAIPNFSNRTLFHGDNLGFLRGINSETIDLIATDPPFKKGRDFHATPDSLASGAKFQDRWSWERDVHQDWVDQITDDYPALMEAIESARFAHSDGMGAYMCFMAVRLMEMHRVLKRTGSIYLHCDPTASHYLKAVMDAIFGWQQFLGEVIWNKGNGVKGRRRWGNENENLLSYARKFGSHVLNATDADLRIPYAETSLSMHFTNVDDSGRHFRRRIVNGKEYIYYADEGRFIGNLWNNLSSMQANTPIMDESTGYPTQKPVVLYERIIRASSNEGDVVLDPFAGCATTCVAAERMSRQWIGMDIWDGAREVVQQRMQDNLQLLINIPEIHHVNEIPDRTDAGEQAAPFLRVKEKVKEPDGPKMSRAEMYDFLLAQRGQRCQGCDREFDDPRYLELDHNTPRADGGINHISNRVLLCGPCNKLKSNIYTLSGLRSQNKKRGYMRG